MTWHNTPAEQFHPEVCYTVFKAFKNNVIVLRTNKNINPVYSSKAYKVQAFFVKEFVFPAQSISDVGSDDKARKN